VLWYVCFLLKLYINKCNVLDVKLARQGGPPLGAPAESCFSSIACCQIVTGNIPNDSAGLAIMCVFTTAGLAGSLITCVFTSAGSVGRANDSAGLAIMCVFTTAGLAGSLIMCVFHECGIRGTCNHMRFHNCGTTPRLEL
jgi:hypothetical protein